jgi:hypothetical protein
MRIDRLVVAAVALVASTIVISCGDNNVTPSNNPVNNPAVTTVSVVETTPIPAPVPGY